MSKRFVDTERRRKELRGVDPKIRLACAWLWENCDAAGVWSIDHDLFKFECGYKLDIESLLKTCGWIKTLPNGSLFLLDFVPVNYGVLKPGYNPHKPVFRSLEANGIEPLTLKFQDLPNPCPRVEEEDKEEGNTQGRKECASEPIEAKVIPMPFTSEAFALAWADWELSRREIKKPLTATSRKAQLAKCLEWGESRAIAALRHSTAGGYQGIYEPTNRTTNGPVAQSQTERDQELARIVAARYAGQ